jgi:hypothetical protein
MVEPILQFVASVDLTAAAGGTKPATIKALAYGGGVLPVNGNKYIVDLAGLSAADTVPLLRDHENQVGAIVGSVRPTVRGGVLYVEGQLARGTAAADQVIALAAAGVTLAVSVGVEPEIRSYISSKQRVDANGQSFVAGDDGLIFVSKSYLREISVVPIGADRSAVASIAAAASTQQPKGKYSMTEFAITPETENHLDAAAAINPDGFVQAAEQRQRLIACWDSSRSLTTDDGKATARQLRASATRGEIGLESYRNQMADLMVAERPKGPGIQASSRDSVGDEILTCAFCKTAGLPGVEKQFNERTLEAADRTFRGGLGLQELLLKCAAEGGCNDHHVIKSGNLREILRAAVGTLSLPGVLSNVANKFLLSGFNSVESVWREICRVASVSDFKTNTRYRLTDSSEYEELQDGGRMRHGRLGEETYTVQAKTYAKMFALTRKDIINDDLGAFDDIRNRLGRGSALKINSVFWKTFLDNAAFFTVAHGNLQSGGGSALASNGTALAAAEQLFLAISDSNGHPLGLTADRLLLPPALGVMADTLVLTTNIWANRFRPLVSAYIAAGRKDALTGQDIGGSDSAWYLLSDPANLATMEVAFLNGQQSPIVESADADFDELGIQFRGYHDFGCAKAEWRGGVKSAGV